MIFAVIVIQPFHFLHVEYSSAEVQPYRRKVNFGTKSVALSTRINDYFPQRCVMEECDSTAKLLMTSTPARSLHFLSTWYSRSLRHVPRTSTCWHLEHQRHTIAFEIITLPSIHHNLFINLHHPCHTNVAILAQLKRLKQDDIQFLIFSTDVWRF